MPHISLRGHHFQAQTHVARIPVTQHLRAARVARQVTTQRATAFRCEAQRKQKPGLFSGVLYLLKNATGFSGEGGVCRVDLTHFVHALQIDHHFATRGVWRGAHDQAGVAALRHHRRANRRACFDHGRYFGGCPRAHHAQCLSVFAAAPVALVRSQAITCQHVDITADQSQAVNQLVHGLLVSTELGESVALCDVSMGWLCASSTCLAKAACCKRHRTCMALAANNTKHKPTSMAAYKLLGQRSPLQRMTPSAKYNHTTKVTQR